MISHLTTLIKKSLWLKTKDNITLPRSVYLVLLRIIASNELQKCSYKNILIALYLPLGTHQQK